MVHDFKLIQEDYSDDPWAVVVCCICLNLTRGSVAKPIIESIFETYPTPFNLQWSRRDELRQMLHPIGLQNKRAITLQRFSRDYRHMPLSNLRKMHGVGRYAYEAYRLVCVKDYSFVPQDKQLLRKYLSVNRDI